MSLRMTAVVAPSPADRVAALPRSLSNINAGETVFLEVWVSVSRDDSASAGLAAVYVDLEFHPSLVRVGEIMPSATFGTLARGAVDHHAGRVSGLGGAALGDDSIGIDSLWVRVATMSLTALRPGRAAFSLNQADSPLGVAFLGQFETVDPAGIDSTDLALRIGKSPRRYDRVRGSGR